MEENYRGLLYGAVLEGYIQQLESSSLSSFEMQVKISWSKFSPSYPPKHMRYEQRALTVNDSLFCLLGILQCICDRYNNHWFTSKRKLTGSLLLLLLPDAEISLIAESFGRLNDLLLPFLSILDTNCLIFYLHLANDIYIYIYIYIYMIYIC